MVLFHVEQKVQISEEIRKFAMHLFHVKQRPLNSSGRVVVENEASLGLFHVERKFIRVGDEPWQRELSAL